MPTPTDIKQSLIDQDVEFRRLAEEHSRCESQLETIVKQPYLCSEDLIEEIALKKQKLRLKDRMELIVSRYQHSVSH
ncbi:MAG TPA: YdcH family protein [Candidatus Acidoferrales bacterium]